MATPTDVCASKRTAVERYEAVLLRAYLDGNTRLTSSMASGLEVLRASLAKCEAEAGISASGSCAGMPAQCAPPVCHPITKVMAPQYFNLPCDERTVDCVLFRKAAFLAKRAALRVKVSVRPRGAEQQIIWLMSVCRMIDGMLEDTNIRPEWIVGGVSVAVDPQTKAFVPSLPAALWPNTRDFLARVTREAYGGCFPFVTFLETADVHAYHRLADFAQPVPAGCRTGSTSVGLPGISGRGLGFLPSAEEAAPRNTGWPYRPGPTGYDSSPAALASQRARRLLEPATNRMKQDLYGRGAVVRWPPAGYTRLSARPAPSQPIAGVLDYAAEGDYLLAYARAEQGSGLSAFTRYAMSASQLFQPERAQRTEAGGRYPVGERLAMAKMEMQIDYYVALATDLLETPYETYVLVGIENWAKNMQVWAARGYLNMAPEEFRAMADAALSARMNASWSMGAAAMVGVVSAVNPVAGAVAGAVSALIGLVLSSAISARAPFMPHTLTLRGASGDCDFSRITGAGATDRVARTQRDLTEHYGNVPSSESASSTAVSSSALKPLLIGAGIAAAIAGGWYLLKE